MGQRGWFILKSKQTTGIYDPRWIIPTPDNRGALFINMELGLAYFWPLAFAP